MNESSLTSSRAVLDAASAYIILFITKTLLCNAVCLFGIVSNSVNLAVFISQGFSDSVNISLFALATCDLAGIVFLLWLNISSNEQLIKAVELPYMPFVLQYLTSGIPRLFLTKVTCWITIFITVQRCLCIAWPLKVNTAWTTRNTVIVIATISVVLYFFILFPNTGTGAGYLGWEFSPYYNRSLLNFIYSPGWIAIAHIFPFLNIFWQFASFVAVVCSTGTLVFQLHKRTKLREIIGLAGKGKLESLSKRDRKLARMIISLSLTLIVCYTPSVVCFLISISMNEYDLNGRYANLFGVLWYIAYLFEGLNASVTFLVYYKMSSKYRQTLSLICCRMNKRNS